MTSLFMGTIVTTGVPADEKTVRNTATPVDVNKAPAMMPDMPVAQEFESDSDPTLGLAPRQLASKWHEGETVQHNADVVSTQNVSNQIVNAQVSTSGTAASRELAGQTHKNLSFAEGIEPVFDLQDSNHKMNNTYFVREGRPVQEPAENYMSVPPGMSSGLGTEANIVAYGKVASRDAAQSAAYKSFGDWLNGNVNG